MKPGDLVEWLEQALAGAVEAQKPKREPEPVRPRRGYVGKELVMAVVRYLGMRDVEAHTSAVRDVIFVRGRCQRGHAIDAEVPQLLWGPDSYEAARVVVEALECKACRSI